MKDIVKSKVSVVGEIKTDRTIVMRGSICMVMESQPHNGEAKTHEQGKDESFLHHSK